MQIWKQNALVDKNITISLSLFCFHIESKTFHVLQKIFSKTKLI